MKKKSKCKKNDSERKFKKSVLNGKHAMFVAEYIKDFNATRAYRVVYKCSDRVANVNGTRLLVSASVQDMVRQARDKILKKIDVDVEKIYEELKSIGFSNFFAVLKKIGRGEKLTEEEEKVISGRTAIKTKTGGSITYRAHDKLKALELLCKCKGLFKDGLDIDSMNVTVKFGKEDEEL